ncbi:MAG: hypothetical protein ABI680_02655 [Chthoniobacteraceae bacterium]
MKSICQALTASFTALLILAISAAQQAAAGSPEVIVVQGPKPVSEDDWRFSLSPYAWIPSFDLDISVPTVKAGGKTIGGEFNIEQPWWDTLSHYSSNFYVLSFSARVEAWKGRWGGFIDGYWIFGKSSVSGKDSRVGPRGRIRTSSSYSITSRFDTGQVNFGPQFMLGTAPLGANSNVSFVLYGGGRINWIGADTDGTIKFTASSDRSEIGQQTNFNTSDSRTFIEPMIGLKTMWTLGDNWRALLRGDVGGFGWVTANNWDCDLEAAIGWQCRKDVYLSLGYRARGLWQDIGPNSGGSICGWYFGPELGLTIDY